nr:disintegrin and metalloproteinase domain-containing protein 32-like [Columba livia]
MVPGQACWREASGAVAVLQGTVTLESFSILLAQMLGRSLGIGYDRSPACRCPAPVCVMSPQALHSSGAKAFSSCSVADFAQFLRHNRDCPFIRQVLPQLSYRGATVCGNGVVDPGEQCDCGTAESCLLDNCCTPQCTFKPGVKCSVGLCCEKCQLKRQNAPCRPPADAQCDLPELCDGSSASCPPDLYVQDGHDCERGTGYCYKGRCRSPDLQCQRLYGRGAKNAPSACYEEVNSQQDRFGHCGNDPKSGYKPCSWPNLACGKLVCTYPNRIPFKRVKGAIIYAHVQEHLCVSFDFMRGPTVPDPLLVKDGTKCGPAEVCINGTCHPHSVLKYDCNAQEKCNGHGVCNNEKNCHCDPGWKPPYCKTQGSSIRGSTYRGSRAGDGTKRSRLAMLRNGLLLGFAILFLTLSCSGIAICKWRRWKNAKRGQQTDG